jgi:glutathione S-transferase
MKLYWSPNSPYARKVVVVTKEMQIDHRVEIIETSAIPTKANEVLSALNPDLGTVTVGCALEYLDFRFSDRPWRSERPQLSAWHEQFALRPSMTSTRQPG